MPALRASPKLIHLGDTPHLAAISTYLPRAAPSKRDKKIYYI
jgi:hypothetical protein